MYEKMTLDNGVRILFEKIPHVRSAAVGIWIGCGSRMESAAENGAVHFIEHMLFKGTKTRSASDLAEIMDLIGGRVNAFTTKECTCFHGHVLDIHLKDALDVLSDMLLNSRFDEGDINVERGVIFEEIDMDQDSYEDLVLDRLEAKVFAGSPLARPILGTKKTLSAFTGGMLREYKEKNYLPERTVIAISGSFDMSDVRYAAEKFSAIPPGRAGKRKKAEYKPGFTVKRKSSEQNHLCIAFPGFSMTDERRYSVQVLSTILGGGLSSRLFQTVREKLGLCYGIYSFNSSYADAGIFGISTALGPETEEKAVTVIKEQIDSLCSGVTEEEVDRAREQAKANILMGLESTVSRMNRLGRNELFLGYVPDVDEVTDRYSAATREGILSLAGEIFDWSRVSFSALGRVRGADEYRKLLTP